MQEWLVEWQATRMCPVLTAEHSTEKIAVVPDNARFHHAKALTGRHEPGQPLERIERDTERDNFMSADEALEYGLIDKVMTSRTEATGKADAGSK